MNAHIYILLLATLTLAACTSIYESGTDQRADWDFSPVSAVNSGDDELAPVAAPQGLYFTSNRERDGEDMDRIYLLPSKRRASRADDVRRSEKRFDGASAGR
jgi:dipeptidyl aminopeptidase/acylaminoacyl peptidase